MIPSTPREEVFDTLQAGRRVGDGRFEILSRLGKGGGATVYRARMAGADGDVALKVLADAHHRDPTAEERFVNEARVAAALSDVPGVVRVLDTGTLPELGQRSYIAFEFIGGPNLAATLIQGPLAVGDAIALFVRLARTVQALHDRGVVHRDIKPSNIVVARTDGRPYLIDFGIAHSVGRGPMPVASGLTGEFHRPGTKEYMAPEQALGEPVTPSFDVYALAGTLHAALTGRPPLFGQPGDEIVRYKCNPNKPEVALNGSRESLPARLVEIVNAGLRRQPTERIDSAQSLADRLGELSVARERTELVPVARVSGADAMRVAPDPVAGAVDTQRQPVASPARPATSVPVLVAPAPALALSPTPASSPTPALSPTPMPASSSVPVSDSVSSQAPLPPKAASRNLRIWAAGILVVVVTLASGLIAMRNRSESPESHAVVVPSAPVRAPGPDVYPEMPTADVPSAEAPAVAPVDLDASTGLGGAAATSSDDGPDEGPSIDTSEVNALEAPPPAKAKPIRRAAKPPEPAAWSTPACALVREAASADRDQRSWASVLRAVTTKRKCWGNRASERLELHVSALVGLTRYDACARLGAGSSNPRIQKIGKQCERKVRK